MKVRPWLFTLLVLAFIGQFIFLLYQNQTPTTVFKKGVRFGEITLAGKDWHSGIQQLEAIFNKPLYLNSQESSRAVTLSDIGITIDRDRLARYTEVCRYKNPKLFCQPTSNEPVNSLELVHIDNQKLNAYLDALEEDFQFIKNNTIISFEDYTFRTLSSAANVKLDRTPFSSKEAIAALISQPDIRIQLNVETEDNVEEQHKRTEQLINNMAKPLLIKYGKNPIWIPADTIKGFMTTLEKNSLLYGQIRAEPISDYLDILKESNEKEDVILIKADAMRAIQAALLFRATDFTINNAVILPIEGLPRTNGELHDTYMEVLKSQQRLYVFEGGKLKKSYIISTGLTWDTPAGEYSVLGKQKMTISYFGNWYMPNYLPIGTIFGVYKFGFHEIPYHMDAQGNIYSRDENTMGSPATGGCIQLRHNDSLELYEWAKVGTPVYIYD